MADRDGRGTGGRPRLDPTLYLVTDAAMCAPRPVADVVAAAVAGGVTAVQVRAKGVGDRDLLAMVRSVQAALADRRDVAVVVDDAVDVALVAGADGVHVGRSDLPPDAVRALVGPGMLVGLSAGREADLDAALALPPATLDYVGIGPVWATTTKAEATVGIGLEALAALAARARSCGLVTAAIGGIDAGRAPSVRAAGVDGLCVVSAVCAAPDPAAAAAALTPAPAAAP